MRLATIRARLSRVKIMPPREVGISFMTSAEQRRAYADAMNAAGFSDPDLFSDWLYLEACKRGLRQRDGRPFSPPSACMTDPLAFQVPAIEGDPDLYPEG